MGKEKINTIERITNKYEKIPFDKQMFVLGIMWGILLTKEPEQPCKPPKQTA